MLIEQVVELVFLPLLLVGQPCDDLLAPFGGYSQLFQKAQGQFIHPKGGIGSAQQNPKQTQAVFGCCGAVGRIERVAEHMTVLVLSIDPRPRAVEVLPWAPGEACSHHLRPLGMERLLIFDQQVGKLPGTHRHAKRV